MYSIPCFHLIGSLLIPMNRLVCNISIPLLYALSLGSTFFFYIVFSNCAKLKTESRIFGNIFNKYITRFLISSNLFFLLRWWSIFTRKEEDFNPFYYFSVDRIDLKTESMDYFPLIKEVKIASVLSNWLSWIEIQDLNLQPYIYLVWVTGWRKA